MNTPLRLIRKALGLSQTEMARVLGCVQSNISFYENGQTIPPDVAKSLIDFSASKGLRLTFDHVYGAKSIGNPSCVTSATPAAPEVQTAQVAA